MVDLVGDVRCELAERVVGQLGEVDDGVEAGQVGDVQLADVLDQRAGRDVDAVVEPTLPVEAGVDAGDLVAAAHQLGREQAAEVALGAGDQDAHQFHTFQAALPWSHSRFSSVQSR